MQMVIFIPGTDLKIFIVARSLYTFHVEIFSLLGEPSTDLEKQFSQSVVLPEKFSGSTTDYENYFSWAVEGDFWVFYWFDLVWHYTIFMKTKFSIWKNVAYNFNKFKQTADCKQFIVHSRNLNNHSPNILLARGLKPKLVLGFFFKSFLTS